ncbi:MAG TPA: hypothetical protein VND65_21055 [Candidatus Binatia bacterium]|nr:hypothetical protein [Candidatus Binatia bacterium]
MNCEWHLHYEGWVIEDGQPDRKVGETFDWGLLSFWSEDEHLRVTDHRVNSASAVDDFKYSISGEVIYLADNCCVIDFGLKAAGSADILPAGCATGDYVTGVISIELPLCIALVPQEILAVLRHRWAVRKISADLTPDHGFTRDKSQIRFEEVLGTNLLKARSYVLHCSEVA